MEQKSITKQQQMQGLKEVFEVLSKLQEEIPGKYFQVLADLKNAIGTVNNAISAEIKVEITPPVIESKPTKKKVLANGELQGATI